MDQTLHSVSQQTPPPIMFLSRQSSIRTPSELGDVVWAQKPKKQPAVLTRDEVKALLNGLEDEKWIIGNLLYGAGLRLIESIRLRVKDVDFRYRQIFPPHALRHSFTTHLL